jgi:hypothetical protein
MAGVYRVSRELQIRFAGESGIFIADQKINGGSAMQTKMKLGVKILDPKKVPAKPAAPLTTPPPPGPDSTAEQPRIVDPGPV